MTPRLPHVREPSSGEPDVCVHCLEEWVDLLTLYERDECSVRLRAEVERLRALEADAAAERAAVVAWLRSWNEVLSLRRLVDEIERGAHRREEKP
jgi:hypothetical protein